MGRRTVGKMTVGQELAKKTNLRVFHNHLIIDALLPLFDFDSPAYKTLVKEFRTRIFEETIKSRSPGMIFTFVIAYNRPSGMQQLNEWINLFKENGFEINIVELQANLKKGSSEMSLLIGLAINSLKEILNSREIFMKNEEEWDMEPKEEYIWIFALFKNRYKYAKA